jgi:hypothetical protein
MKSGHFLIAGLAALAAAIGGEEPALWKLQKLIASKKYVELMARQGTQNVHVVGLTQDLRGRLQSHNKGLIASTKKTIRTCVLQRAV